MIKTKIIKRTEADEEREQPKVCTVRGCGGLLNPSGLCLRAEGYPNYKERQPWICPTCREPLLWSGNCIKCWDRYVQIGPGDCFDERRGHWHNTQAKQTMVPREENQKRLKEIMGKFV